MAYLYPIYGGPLNGRVHDGVAMIHCERGRAPAIIFTEQPVPRPDEALYSYALHDLGGGHRGFLPVADEDLLRAYQATDGQPSNPEAASLLAEIKRRNLDV